MESRTRGLLTVSAGVCIHLVLGSIYVWGNISVYVTSYFRHFDSSLTLQDTFVMLPIIMACNNCTAWMGSVLCLRYNPRVVVVGALILILTGVFVSSFVKSFDLFLVFFGVLFGLGCGFGYTPPILSGWSYYPDNKGRVSGAIVCGFGIGAAIFNQIATAIVNPHNHAPSIKKKEGSVTNHYYDYSIAHRVPEMLRWLCLGWLLLGILGAAFLYQLKSKQTTPNDEPVDETQDTDKELPSVKQGMKERTIYVLFGMCFLSSSLGLYLESAFKVFGDQQIHNDLELSILGSIGQIFNGVSRLFFGVVMDKIGFKKTYTVILVIQIVLAATLYYIAKIYALYFIWFCLILTAEGGQFSIVPTICANIYGKRMGGKMFGVVYFSFGSAAITSALIQKYAISTIGYEAMFWILGSFSAASLAILWLVFDEKSKWTAKSSSTTYTNLEQLKEEFDVSSVDNIN